MHARVCVSRSVVSDSVARQAPLSMEFSRQEPWSGLPFPPPEVHQYHHLKKFLKDLLVPGALLLLALMPWVN